MFAQAWAAPSPTPPSLLLRAYSPDSAAATQSSPLLQSCHNATWWKQDDIWITKNISDMQISTTFQICWEHKACPTRKGRFMLKIWSGQIQLCFFSLGLCKPYQWCKVCTDALCTVCWQCCLSRGWEIFVCGIAVSIKGFVSHIMRVPEGLCEIMDWTSKQRDTDPLLMCIPTPSLNRHCTARSAAPQIKLPNSTQTHFPWLHWQFLTHSLHITHTKRMESMRHESIFFFPKLAYFLFHGLV